MKIQKSQPHVVIIGGGFGGVYVAKGLARAVKKGELAVTLVSQQNYFLFTPLLHEVATGGLSAFSVTESLREIFAKSGIQVIRDDIQSIDPSQKIITGRRINLTYDLAVIANGAMSHDYAIPGVNAYALPLKTLMDAVRVRAQIINQFESSLQTKRSPAFVVVGGGATGVEVVAELMEFVREIGKHYQHERTLPSVTLVSATAEILPQFSPSIRAIAQERLQSNGISLCLNARVTSVEPEGLRLSDGQAVPADVVVWAAGVKPAPMLIDGHNAPNGRLPVDITLRLRSDPAIFALGDAAETPEPLPMLAQVAVAQAKSVARNVLATLADRPLKPFVYRSKGELISLGQWYAAGRLAGFTLKGRFMWWLWRTVYLFKFLSHKKRIRIAFEWTIDLFTRRDTSNLL